MAYNADEYTISVRKEVVDGESYWVARVDELPDVMEFGDSRDEAYDAAIDTIEVGQHMCFEQGTPFPPPKVFDEVDVSGRVTLRLPKPLHLICIKRAEMACVSLNTLLITDIQKAQSESDLSLKVQAEISELKEFMVHHMFNTVQHSSATPSWSVKRASKVITTMYSDDAEDGLSDSDSRNRVVNLSARSRLHHA